MAGASNSQAETVSVLASLGANVDLPETGGHTPLMVAAGRNNEAATRALLEAGADIATVAADGRTAAEIARDAGHHSTAGIIDLHSHDEL